MVETGGKRRPNNKDSQLLSRPENEALFRLLGAHNYTLATGVVQLLAAEPPKRREWQKKHVGVVCFVKDYVAKGYFLRLYDIYKNTFLWEQDFYDGFAVSQKTSQNAPELVTFEGDSCVYGLNFSSRDEASYFTQTVNKRYEQEQKQKTRAAAPPSMNQPNPMSANTTSMNLIAPVPSMNFGVSAGGKGSKKKKLTKNDIGLPTNFEHVVHVGWDPGQGFQANATNRDDLDPQIKMLLDKIGLPTNLGKKDRKLIYDIIDQHGGIDALKNELSHAQPPPPPSRSPPQVPMATYPEGRNYQRNDKPKARELPPPPPPAPVPTSNNARPLPQPPPMPPTPPTRPGPPAPPSGSTKANAPPPPPPPPPPPGPNAPPPPPPLPASTPSGGGGGGSSLLSEIAKGIALKPVSSNESMKSSSVVSDSRDAMLTDIKSGVSLRPVDKQEKQRVTPPEEMGGIAGALARALQERRFQIDDESEEDDDESDDEWDD